MTFQHFYVLMLIKGRTGVPRKEPEEDVFACCWNYLSAAVSKCTIKIPQQTATEGR